MMQATNHTSNQVDEPPKLDSLIRYNHLTYLLYIVSYFTAGLLWIVPIVMNYAKRKDAHGTWLESHFDWQIKTFWYSIVFFILGGLIIAFAAGGLGTSALIQSQHIAWGSLLLGIVGGLLVLFSFIWHLYRIIRGWVALNNHQPVP